MREAESRGCLMITLLVIFFVIGAMWWLFGSLVGTAVAAIFALLMFLADLFTDELDDQGGGDAGS